MIWHRSDDLQAYLRDAILPGIKYGKDVPSLPPTGHKSHCNTLSTRFKKCRHLTGIHYLGASFDEMLNDCENPILTVADVSAHRVIFF